MCVALIGGMDRLERNYINESKKYGVSLGVFTKYKPGIANKISNADAIVLFTNKVSHKARREVMNTAKSMSIPFYMNHSCGICSLRECLSYLVN